MKKIGSLCLALVMLIGILGTNFVYAAGHYSSDYRQWSQGASGYPRVKSYGCFIIAMAKMIVEAGVDTSSSFDPDVFAKWEEDNGFITSLTSSVGQNNKLGPQKYAEQRGNSLTYMGPVVYSDNQLWNYINDGYYCIVHIGYGNGYHHYVFVSNSDSKNTGELTFYESGKSSVSIGAMNKSKLLSRYKNSSITTIFAYKSAEKSISSNPSVNNKNSEINIDLTSYPTSLKQGSNFGLRGTISSANELKRIEGFIKKGNDTVQSTTDYPNKTSVNVKGINLNKNLIFDNLGTGDYTLIVSATDSTGKTVTVKKNFSVYAEQTRADSSLSINLTRYPVTLDAGTSFGLRGSVDSNYSIARVRGYVKDSNGSVVLSSNDTPGSTSMNIQYADLNNSLVFNRLSPGSYTMIVEATDTSGRVVTATKDFSVRSKETYTDNSSSGSGVDGTVQIPSSWDDLSIRKGPSTDYTIVGSMPQGARCTVYPDRTVNGWYYVNYNGIWGYASGRQINLNSGGSASSNTRVGIINIPSSWDDLSIRTGPSTDYTIVGSMPQGARCTVYPDKASGGWYYVEYNGVQGYAAGNRINLQ